MQIIRIFVFICVLSLPSSRLIGQAAEKDTTKQRQETQQKTKTEKTSFVQKMLRIFGITATTSLQKSDDHISSGQIWICSVDGEGHRLVTAETGFRSPILLPGNEDIIALEKETVMHIDIAAAKVTEIKTLRKASKIIGYDKDDPKEVYLLCKDKHDRPTLVNFNLETGKQKDVIYDASDTSEQLLLNYVSSEQRNYDGINLFVESNTDFITKEEWRHIFIRRRDGTLKNITEGEEANFGQPALSHDKQLITYIKIN